MSCRPTSLATSQDTSGLKSLRGELVRRRTGLPADEVARVASRISRRLWRLGVLARCRRLACYVAVRQEAGCGDVITAAWSRGREVYLPVLRARELAFAPYRPGTRMVRNRYGIPEPAADGMDWCRSARLDVVLLPVVGFDLSGTRLGMGGGYYDRTFRFLLHRQRWHRPWLIGIAYDFQRVDALPRRCWDVSLDAVVTERHVYEWRSGHR